MPEPLLIADVPWLLYRGFFSVPKSVLGAAGEPVNALLGTVNAFLTVLGARPARAVVACFGAEQATYRVDLYPPYHAHREPMPPELRWQWGKAPTLLASLGWSICDAAELEADDAMYSHARTEAEAGGNALLLTGDRDLYAAVEERVAIVELAKGRVAGELGPEQVRERYGVAPEQVADFIALRGDASDGLPGAPGVGAKTAAELLREHRTLEGVLSAAQGVTGPIRPRIATALRENADLLLKFREIATLQRIPVERPATSPTDYPAGAGAARELGMNGLAERLESLAA